MIKGGQTIDIQIDFADGTLPTEHQVLVRTLNRFLALHPDNEDGEAAVRLVMELLELADVAPQEEIAQAVGYAQSRSLRTYQQRLQEQGLGGLFDQPIPGRPAVTSQSTVERAVVQAVLEAVITEHALPDDDELAQAANHRLAETPWAGQVTASMVETIRLRLGIQRPTLAQQLQAALSTPSTLWLGPTGLTAAEAQIRLGRTRAGGAFILAVLLIETGWLKLAGLLPMVPGYAVTAEQWLLTAILAVVYGVQRAFHLDDVRDIGFALITGRARPLTHGTFQHLLHHISAQAAKAFYEATALRIVRGLGEGTRRISLDGHNLPRYTQIVDLVKGKIGNLGRILKAEELVLAFDLDAREWLALRVYQGTNKLRTALLEMVAELRQHRAGQEGLWRLFFDKGGYKGQIFQGLVDQPDVHFYCPAVRYASNVEQWEELSEDDFQAESFVFAKHSELPSEEQPIYRLADTEMTLNVRDEKNQVVDTVTLRAVVIQDPDGQTTAKRWPVTFLTDDREIDARKLANEFGDHWGQEFGHRIGRHDLCLDILPPGYKLVSQRDKNGDLQRKVTYDSTAFFLSAWLRCLVFNLMTRFAQALGGECATMWAGTLLRKFIRRPATLYLVGKELHVVFDPFPDQDELRPLLDELNAKRVGLPWLNDLIVQFSIAKDEPIHPLTEPEKRNRLFGDD